MKLTALLLSVALASTPPSLTTERPASRGFLSGLGLGLLVVGLGGLGAGVAGNIAAEDANSKMLAYQGMATNDDLAAFNVLRERFSGNTTLALVGFIGGGLALVGGVTCLLIDTPKARVAFVPGPHGGALVFSGNF